MAGARGARWGRSAVEGITRREVGEGNRNLEDSSRRQELAVAGRRLIALLAVVREAATLFSAIPHLSLSDVPYGVRQSYRTVYRAHRGSAGAQPAAGIPAWTIHSPRTPEGS